MSYRHHSRSRSPLTALRALFASLFACLALVLPAHPAGAIEGGDQRFAEFLKNQGTFCLPDGEGGCQEIAPGVPNFLVWSDLDPDSCAVVDYAGLAAEAIRQQSGGAVRLGTRVTGTVTETPLPDGRSDVRIRLHAKNALTYVVQGCDWLNGPPLFGRFITEVVAGKRAALGNAQLDIRFTNETGVPLPDILQLLIEPLEGQVPLSMTFKSSTKGPLREAFGVPDGTPGKADVHTAIQFDDPDNRTEEIRLTRQR
ncbi:hypothetical protein ABT237_11600 [Streptomyces sp. NPDC001581]|uniref:hypothetical protein n=1 Tax=Streptomyces sp. NPDC001581 TaxID=3154386 RepID=UPI00332E12AB